MRSLFNYKLISISIFAIVLSSCGQAYFPIELKTISRSDRKQMQESIEVNITPMTSNVIKLANKEPYKRRIVEAGDLQEPARLITTKEAIIESLPPNKDPGPYLLGVGDIIKFTEFFDNQDRLRSIISRNIVVKSDGLVTIAGVGNIKAMGMTVSQLEDQIYQSLVANNELADFELTVTGFNSKKILVMLENASPLAIPYTSNPVFLENVLALLEMQFEPGSDVKIIILRDQKKYVLSLRKLMNNSSLRVRLHPEDKIFIKPLNYRKEAVLIVGETGAQKVVAINSLQRPTLSDTLFSGAILSNVTSDFSQIYVIRKIDKRHFAYHLDITNPARISLSTKFEMRPDDIVFVATQPLSLYSRALSQVLGSTGLTFQARDTVRNEVGN